MSNAPNPIRVFYSYAHEDDDDLVRLAKQLYVLKQSGKIVEWSDREISAGREWHGRISDALKRSQLILLLVSDDFLSSEYINDVELKHAIERHERGDARVVPIILKPCMWREIPALAKLQALPSRAKPVTDWPSPAHAYYDVAKGLLRVIEELRGDDGSTGSSPETSPPSEPAPVSPSEPPPAVSDERATRIKQLEALAKSAELELAALRTGGDVHQTAQNITGSSVVQIGGSGHGAAAAPGGVAIAGENIRVVFEAQRVEVKPKEAEALADYLAYFRPEWQQLALAGIDDDEASPETRGERVELEQVYVGLNVLETDPARAERDGEKDPRGGLAGAHATEPWSAIDACTTHPRCVVLGDPGAGKSTFLRRLAMRLADGFGADEAAGPFGQPLLPVMVTLRDFAEDLGGKKTADAVRIPKFIKRQLADNDLGDDAYPAIQRLLRDGHAVLMLDGLDEIANAASRATVLASIEAFAEKHAKTRIIVTCRVAAYRDFEREDGDVEPGASDWRLPEDDFPAVTLAPFTPAQMRDFIDRWYHELKRVRKLVGDPDATATELCRALEQPDIARLASNPLLLAVMTFVHAKKGRLPEQRVILYEEAVDTLLDKWRQGRDASDTGGPPRVGDVLLAAGRSFDELETRLWRLAYDVHGKSATGSNGENADAVADITTDDLFRALRTLHPEKSLAWTGTLIEAITFRSGLLLERRRNVYTFPHRTFQEYLAARNVARSETLLEDLGELRSAPNDLWREVILMAGGTFAHLFNDPARVRALIESLLGDDDEHATILAADLAREATPRKIADVERGEDVLERLRTRLDAGMFGDGPIKTRAAYGAALGRLGDERAGVATLDDVRTPEFWSDTIPADPFLMGNDPPEAGYEDESPQFLCDLLTADYAVSRYPVTVGQYRAFVEAGGYAEKGKQWWTEAGWSWRRRHGITAPDVYPGAFQTPNHPQVGVSWYEAFAFCAWLAAEEGLPIRLPTEPEWERAARHVDTRMYPWGNPDPDSAEIRANISDLVGATSAVGLYRSGRAKCGALDMAGNVREWCATKWTDDYDGYQKKHDADEAGNSRRVLRGGSWGGSPQVARCACRGWGVPRGRDGDVGFRLCVSPFSPSDL